MDNDQLAATIAAALEHMPEWVRHDLASKDARIRVRAQETLAAIIAAALRG